MELKTDKNNENGCRIASLPSAPSLPSSSSLPSPPTIKKTTTKGTQSKSPPRILSSGGVDSSLEVSK